jgi:hypothetical protein
MVLRVPSIAPSTRRQDKVFSFQNDPPSHWNRLFCIQISHHEQFFAGLRSRHLVSATAPHSSSLPTKHEDYTMLTFLGRKCILCRGLGSPRCGVDQEKKNFFLIFFVGSVEVSVGPRREPGDPRPMGAGTCTHASPHSF